MAAQAKKKSQLEKKRLARRQYYAENLDNERQKNRERARKQRELESPEDRQLRLKRHRDAQARYRATHRSQLRLKSWSDRKTGQWRKARENDEREFEALMSSVDG